MSWENQFLPYTNNKAADQPARMISTFVIRCLDSITSSFYIWNFKPLASFCSWAGRFESYLVTNPEDRFSRDVAQIKSWVFQVTQPCLIFYPRPYFCYRNFGVFSSSAILSINPMWQQDKNNVLPVILISKLNVTWSTKNLFLAWVKMVLPTWWNKIQSADFFSLVFFK